MLNSQTPPAGCWVSQEQSPKASRCPALGNPPPPQGLACLPCSLGDRNTEGRAPTQGPAAGTHPSGVLSGLSAGSNSLKAQGHPETVQKGPSQPARRQPRPAAHLPEVVLFQGPGHAEAVNPGVTGPVCALRQDSIAHYAAAQPAPGPELRDLSQATWLWLFFLALRRPNIYREQIRAILLRALPVIRQKLDVSELGGLAGYGAWRPSGMRTAPLRCPPGRHH